MKVSPAASTLLSSAQVAAFRARSDCWGIGLVAHAWGVIAIAILVATRWPGPLTIPLAMCVIGSRQLGLLILMHDGAHGMLARTPWLNRVLAQGFCAWPAFADTAVYRRYHLQHHAHTMQPGDPDLVLTGHYPISRRSLFRKLLRDLTGQTGYAQRRAQWRAALGPASLPLPARGRRFLQALGPALATNALIAAMLTSVGHWYSYALFWLLPLLTWQQVVLRVRNIAEHACVERDDPLRNARTTRAGWLARAFIAPYWVNYHLEHHLLMWVPCYRLAGVHAALAAHGGLATAKQSPGYWQVLREVTQHGEEGPSGRARAVGTFSDGFGSP